MIAALSTWLGSVALGSLVLLGAAALWCAWDCRRLIAYHARMLWHDWRER